MNDELTIVSQGTPPVDWEKFRGNNHSQLTIIHSSWELKPYFMKGTKRCQMSKMQ